ncbi:MAG: ribonuclease G [Bacteroidetes bacterium RIFOXYA12_FULL_35_11]|nr:MAG: ribonuclease G [Bacteroidetes bacterium GWF2_35_48]OFY81023.1 MAG: ribonuclease G [Bacteroidetes bacterium RIFOXYA12_FULL_35_11]OFY94742.1 MAG: ribonuclease G [Bacteroidetes bacterium RIFOXYC12_FULL_35_7]HBX49948.1 ribonuclease E/G [Bacteroidales bacterium]
MSNELVIDVNSNEVVIALLENKELAELNREKNNTKFSVGDIYLGRVKKIMPGLNAAFVNVGYEKDAFLHYLDMGPQFASLAKFLRICQHDKKDTMSLNDFKLEHDINKNGKITDIIKQGQDIIVQIAKEPISTKGPRLSSEISIAGRNLVLIPFADKISVSQKIQSEEERSRLKRLIQSIKPVNYGVIVRTVAEGKKVADLDSELRELCEKWESVSGKIKSISPPSLLLGELNRTSAILRDIMNASFNSITVNDEAIYNEIKNYILEIAPGREKILKLYSGAVPIFENFGIEKKIKSLFGKTVPIKNGAYLIIESTEALHVIDVNSGNRTDSEKDQEANALEVNTAAAKEIARQLRLRDLGGIIVIDFIDMHSNENKQILYDKMKEFMSTERAKHHILPLTKFGLMQITRQRVRPATNVKTIETCPTCNGSGEITPSVLLIDQIESNLSYLFSKITDTTIIIKAHPFVAAFIKKGFPSQRLKWRWKYKKIIKVKSSISYSFLEYHLFHSNGEEILL